MFDSGSYLAATGRANEMMMGNINTAANGISAAIERNLTEAKKLKAYRAMAVDGLGMDPDQVDQLDVDTLEGKFRAEVLRRDQQRAGREEEAYQRSVRDRENEQVFTRALGMAANPDPAQLPPGMLEQYVTGEQPQFSMTDAPGGASAPQPLDVNRILNIAGASGVSLKPETVARMIAEHTGGKTFFNSTDPMTADVPGVPGAKRVVLGPNQSSIIRTGTELPEGVADVPGYKAVSDGKGGVKYLPLKSSELTDEDRIKYRLQNEKGIDELVKSLSLAAGDDVTTGIIKARIAAHQKAIDDLAPPGASSKPAAPRGAGSSAPAAALNGRVRVQKGGKIFTVPAEQLEAAKQQGYTEVP